MVRPDTFEAQIDYLAKHRTVISLDEIVKKESPTSRPAVAITFDDGYRNVLTQAGPVLERYGFPSTVFVPTKWIANRAVWLGPTAPAFDIMRPDELLEAERRGIGVESHGHAHIDMSREDEQEVRADIRRSLEELGTILQRKPRYLAYPWGRSSSVTRRAASDEGLEAAFSLDEPHGGMYAFGRVPVSPLDGDRLFRWKTSGDWLLVRRSKLGELAAAAVRPFASRR